MSMGHPEARRCTKRGSEWIPSPTQATCCNRVKRFGTALIDAGIVAFIKDINAGRIPTRWSCSGMRQDHTCPRLPNIIFAVPFPPDPPYASCLTASLTEAGFEAHHWHHARKAAVQGRIRAPLTDGAIRSRFAHLTTSLQRHRCSQLYPPVTEESASTPAPTR